MNRFLLSSLFFFSILPTSSYALSLDDKVSLAISSFNITEASCSINQDLIDNNLTSLGEVVFNTKILSGDKDVSCSDCHLDNKALTDGLSLAIGVGGKGEGIERLNSDGIIVPRNTFTLFGRAHNSFQAFFWDGRVQESNGKIISPIGEGYEKGYTSALALAASMPIIARDEFLGKMTMFNNNKNIHRVEDSYYQEKIPAIEQVIKELLDGNDNDVAELLKEVNDAGYSKSTISLPILGNALASFIAVKLQKSCVKSNWDKYISGKKSALTSEQKMGALLFYGKGRCAGCHDGSLFSDMNFHSIGIPQGKFGTHLNGTDIGRAQVTFKQHDRFKFRTPPLLQVKNTAPYGHNGAFKSLEEIVLFHINPIPYLFKNESIMKENKFSYGKLLTSRSPILGYIEISNESEFKAIIEFLKSI
jgi:cytochrome c peroxidase